LGFLALSSAPGELKKPKLKVIKPHQIKLNFFDKFPGATGFLTLTIEDPKSKIKVKMDADIKNELIRLKKEINFVKRGILKWNSLIEKREELELQIDLLQPELLSHPLQPMLMEKSRQLKKHLRELDALLDHLEEFSPQKVIVLENELISRILQLNPHLTLEFEKIAKGIYKSEEQHEQLRETYTVMIHLQSLLKEALKARQRVKQKGILSYIFGTNPNQVISQHLHAVSEQIDYILPKIKDGHQELTSFLEELHLEAEQRWGFRKIDTYFAQAENQLNRHIEHMRGDLEELEQIVIRAKNERELWIDTQIGNTI